MTHSTQSCSDINVTRKDTPTEVGIHSIKGVQAEHMNNSSQSTPYAQGSAQAEPDDAPDLSDTHTIVDIPGFGKVWAVKNIAIYYDTWLDWHNKQVLEIIGEDDTVFLPSDPLRPFSEAPLHQAFRR